MFSSLRGSPRLFFLEAYERSQLSKGTADLTMRVNGFPSSEWTARAREQALSPSLTHQSALLLGSSFLRGMEHKSQIW
jgi:hypothetical protein